MATFDMPDELIAEFNAVVHHRPSIEDPDYWTQVAANYRERSQVLRRMATRAETQGGWLTLSLADAACYQEDEARRAEKYGRQEGALP